MASKEYARSIEVLYGFRLTSFEECLIVVATKGIRHLSFYGIAGFLHSKLSGNGRSVKGGNIRLII